MELVVNIGVTLAAFVLLYLSNRRLSLPSFGQLFAFFYVFFIIIGSYVIFFDNPEKYSSTLMLVNSGFLAFCAGSFLSSAFNMLSAKDYERFHARPIVDRYNGTPFVFTAAVLFSMAFVLSALFFRNGIPILSYDVDAARYAATVGGGYYFIGIFIFLPFVTLLLMAKTYMAGNGAYKPFFYLVLAITVLISILSGFRAPLAALLLMMVLLNFYIKGRFTWKSIFVGLFLFLVVFIGITYIKLKDEPMALSLVGEVFMRRVVLENPTVIALIQDVFPGRFEFMLGGSYLMDFISAMPGPGISFGGWLFSQTPSLEYYGIAAMTPTLIGELYANFSAPAAVVIVSVFGYFLNNLYIRFLRSERDVTAAAIWIAFVLPIANSVMLGLGFLIFTKLIQIAFITAVFFVLYSMFRAIARRALPFEAYAQADK